MEIRLIVTGRMYHLAAELPEQFDLPEGATLRDALQWVQSADEVELPGSCLVAVNGEHCGTIATFTNRGLAAGDELALIAPVAGG